MQPLTPTETTSHFVASDRPTNFRSLSQRAGQQMTETEDERD
jgi:hypothetical protein